ncbi:MAG: sugar ABC transporter permease [Clostridia bacterium]|nr:sugar ABC transporter permease [Clostridia bacterium]
MNSRGIKRRLRLSTFMPYIYVAPMIIFLLVFSAWPFFTAIKTSFYRNDGMTINDFIGIKNYVDILFHDRLFWKSMGNLFYLFLGMNVCFVSPIITAKFTYMLSSERLKYIIRSAFTITTVVPTVVTMMLWKFIYYPNIGLIARIAEYLGMASPNLLGDERTAILAVIFIGFPWVNGLSFLMYFASLQSMDESLVEAAKIDGANAFQQFFKIELPMMMPLIASFYVIAFIGQFQDYEKFLILTSGGPNNATLTPALYMYQKAFGTAGESEFGYACAIAMVLFVITFILSRLLQRGDKDE